MGKNAAKARPKDTKAVKRADGRTELVKRHKFTRTRSNVVFVRLNDEELEAVQEAAKEAALTVTVWARQLLVLSSSPLAKAQRRIRGNASSEQVA